MSQGPLLPGDSRGGSISLLVCVTGRIHFLAVVGPRSPFLTGSQLLRSPMFLVFKNLVLAALGLHCWVRAFSSCGERGLLFVEVHGLLIAAEHGL